MKKAKKKSRTLWHRILGKILEELLTPFGISVHTETPVMSNPPQLDILILRRNQEQWTSEQLAILPDGIRDSQATDILLEFKYTESIDDDAWMQAFGYKFFYQQAQQLDDNQIQTFLLSAKQPQSNRLKQWGYKSTKHRGVYQSQERFLNRIILISLNELADEPHNAWVKCFASHKNEKKKAFARLKQLKSFRMTNFLKGFISGFWQHWFINQGDDMSIEMTVEQITEMGKFWGNTFFSGLTPKERVAGLKPAEVLAEFKPAEVLAEFKPAERVAGLKPAEVLAEFKPAEVLAEFKPTDRLAGLKPADRLAGLSQKELDEIEHLILKRKK